VLLRIIVILYIQQTNAQIIYSKDVDNFWIAYDKIHKLTSYSEQINAINAHYLNAGTSGLKQFCKIMKYTDSAYVNAILRYPKFWNSLRTKTKSLEEDKNRIEKHIINFKKLYTYC